MEDEQRAIKRYKLRAFLWDQFILPLGVVFNIKHIKTALLIIAIFDVLVLRNYWYSYLIPGFLLLILIIYDDIYKSWKSGEFIRNYRDHKYPEYRKAIKEVRKARKERNGNIEPKEDLIKVIKDIEKQNPKVVILDDNPLSVASYMEEHPKELEEHSESERGVLGI